MQSKNNYWTKKELQIYILLLCANADANETSEELNIIKSKTDLETFTKIYEEFSNDTEGESFEKIDDCIHQHDFSHHELIAFRKEMQEIFNADNKFSMFEENLNKIMDNMLY